MSVKLKRKHKKMDLISFKRVLKNKEEEKLLKDELFSNFRFAGFHK